MSKKNEILGYIEERREEYIADSKLATVEGDYVGAGVCDEVVLVLSDILQKAGEE